MEYCVLCVQTVQSPKDFNSCKPWSQVTVLLTSIYFLKEINTCSTSLLLELLFSHRSSFFGIYVDVIMVWNIRYGTLQSWQTLDKITEKQSTLLGHMRSNGASCACCIPGFICGGFHHCVAVCQLSIDTCSLASALGQLDATEK